MRLLRGRNERGHGLLGLLGSAQPVVVATYPAASVSISLALTCMPLHYIEHGIQNLESMEHALPCLE